MGTRIELPHTSVITEDSFYLGQLSTVFHAEVFAISKVAEKLCSEGTRSQKIVVLSDSQAAIKALGNNTVRSNTVFYCIEALNKLRADNQVLVSWIFGHEGIEGNEKADDLAKEGSELKQEGPEPFVPVPYASCKLGQLGIGAWNDGKHRGMKVRTVK